MDNYQNQIYLEPNEYLHKYITQSKLSAIIFDEIIDKNQELKNKIIMNFLARGVMTSKSIFTLWQEGDFSNCQVLLRILLERYLFLIYLSKNNLFNEFNDKTFIEEHELVHKQRCDEYYQR